MMELDVNKQLQADFELLSTSFSRKNSLLWFVKNRIAPRLI